jgi:hypothetical protein
MDPYVYPETNVLRNLRDIRDAERFSNFEAIATTRRSVELEHKPIAAGLIRDTCRQFTAAFFRTYTNGPKSSAP